MSIAIAALGALIVVAILCGYIFKLCTKCNELDDKYSAARNECETLRESLSNLQDSRQEYGNDVIAKVLEIMVGLATEAAEEVHYFYVGDLSTEAKVQIKKYFKQYGDETTNIDSMWWSRYDKDGNLDPAAKHIQADDAAFICFA